MQVINTIEATRSAIKSARGQGLTIALVPTMGNLHDGHLALIEHAKTVADYVITTIFVNAMQFSLNEDLDAYPRTLQADIQRLEQAQVNCLFTPTMQEIYPHGTERHCQVIATELSEVLCGEHRPGHFSGVLTIVAKLFNIVVPDIAIFGEKDWQQLTLIKNMVRDLNWPIDILSVPTYREASGLAMSSRNNYLDTDQRKLAAGLYQILLETKQKLLAGETHYETLEEQARQQLRTQGFKPDYVSIRSQQDLASYPQIDDKALIILAAAYLGNARLIDNISLRLHSNDD